MQYYEIPINESLNLARKFIADGNEWHSHAISPGCHFNPYQGLYAVMIEDNTENKIYIAPSIFFPWVDKDLVRPLHGNDILDPKPSFTNYNESLSSRLLVRVMGIDRQGIHWHHHMNFPKCLMTPNTDKWMITIESDDAIFEEEYNVEPKEILRQLEILYFQHMESSG
jgi:hypothetical protein